MPCGPAVDLRNSAVAGLPSAEQGDTYACGYFASATFLDSFRKTHGGIEAGTLPADPIALALDVAIANPRPRWLPIQVTTDPLSETNGRRGSFLCAIIDQARESGVCDPGDPRVLDREWTTKRSNQALVLYRTLHAYAGESKTSQTAKLHETVGSVRAAIAQLDTPASNEDLTRIVWEYRNDPYRAIRALLYPSCAEGKPRRPFRDLPSCETDWYLGPSAVGIGSGRARGRAIASDISASFDEKLPLPVPVLHCFQVMREGRKYDGSSILSSDCILHYVNVIGRREHGGTCQFLVRNSYDPSDEYAVSKDWERDGVDFWVDAETFGRSAYAVHYYGE